jgi:processing peptidase subunit beta
VILRESEEVEKQLEEVVFDHLHATAFQTQPLGRTILGPRENIRDITRTELVNYIKHNYTADRMVLVGAGGIPHEKLVELAEKSFTNLPTQTVQTGALLQSKKKTDFIGSDIRIRDDTMPTANIAIAVEGVSWKDDDYFTALVAQAIVGNYDKALGNAPHTGSKLSSFVHQNDLATSFMSFSTSYSDTGYVANVLFLLFSSFFFPPPSFSFLSFFRRLFFLLRRCCTQDNKANANSLVSGESTLSPTS